VTNMKMYIFWDVTPCSLIHIDRRFRGVSFIRVIVLMMATVKLLRVIFLIVEEVNSSETSVCIYYSAR
jgi:hypothetical protein